jgi:hypothetical protein
MDRRRYKGATASKSSEMFAKLVLKLRDSTEHRMSIYVSHELVPYVSQKNSLSDDRGSSEKVFCVCTTLVFCIARRIVVGRYAPPLLCCLPCCCMYCSPIFSSYATDTDFFLSPTYASKRPSKPTLSPCYLEPVAAEISSTDVRHSIPWSDWCEEFFAAATAPRNLIHTATSNAKSRPPSRCQCHPPCQLVRPVNHPARGSYLWPLGTWVERFYEGYFP